MARIKHIAIRTADPEKTAKFYQETFGLKRAGLGRNGIYLTDGHINLAILKGGDKLGIEHLGFQVDDVDTTLAKVAELGGSSLTERVKATRDADFQMTGADGTRVNRLESIAHIGGATLDNEEESRAKLQEVEEIAQRLYVPFWQASSLCPTWLPRILGPRLADWTARIFLLTCLQLQGSQWNQDDAYCHDARPELRPEPQRGAVLRIDRVAAPGGADRGQLSQVWR